MKRLLCLLVVAILGSTIARAAPVDRAELHFPGGAPAPLVIDGIVYRAELRPDPPEDVVSVDLVLTRGGHGRNLLEPKGHWHGPEPFMFLSWDLKNGTAGSMYGRNRVFGVGPHRLSAQIRSVEVAQGKTGPVVTRLSLDLVLDRVGAAETISRSPERPPMP